MLEDFSMSAQTNEADTDSATKNLDEFTAPSPGYFLNQTWEKLVRFGLGEVTLRIATGTASVILVLLVLWVMNSFYLKGKFAPAAERSAQAAILPTSAPAVEPPPLELPSYNGAYLQGVTRVALLHTNLPSRPRFKITEYIVQKGDTIFGIAEKFNLRPETIMWGNYHILADNPHRLAPDQVLNILPVDGVYYQWHAGDGLNAVAKFYGVQPEEIVNWPGNNLAPDTLGDWSEPNIKPGTWLVIPGGQREYISWSAPRITRTNTSVAKVMGPGACQSINDGPIGTGTFLWPTVEKGLSGYDYSPSTNHYGIDIGGKTGYAIFASDNGVVVYAGWNDWGYGNTIVIDHGNGWQSLYAHLDSYSVSCGAFVFQGNVIGTLGSTGNSSGPHLHFELRSDEYGRPNPWNFLQR